MTDQTPPDPFTADVVAAICAHMNDDHPDDTLLICRALGSQPEATAARMIGVDAVAGEFVVERIDGEVEIRIPWSHRLTSRGDVRVEVVRMYQEACATLGLAPRGEGEHEG